MKISGSTKVHDLLETHPFLENFLPKYNPKFEMLKNRMARATIGRVATLRTAAGIANLELGAFINAIADEIEKQTGRRPETDLAAGSSAPNREQRMKILREIIGALHDGGSLEEAKKRFAEAVGDVEASEIAAMEQELIKNGLPVSEVQRLCDVHVGAFRHALDEHAEVQVPTGHPVDTYLAANKVITGLADELGEATRDVERGDDAGAAFEKALSVVDKIGGIENHYQRKENQLFPILERHGITGPSQVMWGVHDEIRARLKTVREAARAKDPEKFVAEAPALARDLVEMVYKEEKILFPMSLQTLASEEWGEIRRGEDELGYVLAKPSAPWPEDAGAGSDARPSAGSLLGLMTGELSLEQLNLLLTHLPVDLSFVDENDTVRFYSEGERIFPRSPAVIGRKVQNCHPPKSVHTVQEILDSFRAGKKDVAEFWIQLKGRFIHIRYFAIRDDGGAYRGCLEVSQDVTGIRELEGERRLLEWQDSGAT
jgi:DUF438 domain-containing protein